MKNKNNIFRIPYFSKILKIKKNIMHCNQNTEIKPPTHQVICIILYY